MKSSTTTVMVGHWGRRPQRAIRIASIVGLMSILAVMCLSSVAFASSHAIEITSTNSSGVQGSTTSLSNSTSADGRYIAFQSWATNLVAGDTNGDSDVFVKDTQTGVTTRVSTASDGTQGDADSMSPVISSGGRYVAFESEATNLVAGDSNGYLDIFIKDTQTGVTTRVSTDSSGAESDDESYYVAISSDGRYVIFTSYAANLVTGDTNGDYDLFMKDTQTGVTTRVSISSGGTEGDLYSEDLSYMSSDGRYVAFTAHHRNLVSGDTNAKSDVFLRDTQTGVTTRVSTDSAGAQSDGHSMAAFISANGRYVVFTSDGTNLVAGDTNAADDIFIKDTQTGVTTRVSTDSAGAQTSGPSYGGPLSDDGRFITFQSNATDLVTGDTNAVNDVFVKNLQTGEVFRLSTDSSGAEGSSHSYGPSASIDGRYIDFYSSASNLVSPDSNGNADTFRVVNPLWAPPIVSVWPRASSLTFGLWSKLGGTVHDSDGNPVEDQKVYLQYLDVAVSSLDKQGAGTWKWLKNVYTDSNGYYQHWFYYEGGTRTYRAKESTYGQLSNTTQIAFTNNISAWNTYRPTVKYCQWTKIHGKYGGPDGLNKNTTLYLQRKSGSTWVWQATVATDSTGYYAAWAMVCPTTQLRMGTGGSAVTSAAVTKTGSTITAWQNSNVHAVLKDGFGSGVSGISLYLQKWNGSAWTWQATCSTSSTGYCNFGSVSPLGDVRVATWGSRVVSGTL